MTLEELEKRVDFQELFTGIWAAVEYGNDKEQYKRAILDLVNSQKETKNE